MNTILRAIEQSKLVLFVERCFYKQQRIYPPLHILDAQIYRRKRANACTNASNYSRASEFWNVNKGVKSCALQPHWIPSIPKKNTLFYDKLYRSWSFKSGFRNLHVTKSIKWIHFQNTIVLPVICHVSFDCAVRKLIIRAAKSLFSSTITRK